MNQRRQTLAFFVEGRWKIHHARSQEFIQREETIVALDIKVVDWPAIAARITLGGEVIPAIKIEVSYNEVAVIIIRCGSREVFSRGKRPGGIAMLVSSAEQAVARKMNCLRRVFTNFARNYNSYNAGIAAVIGLFYSFEFSLKIESFGQAGVQAGLSRCACCASCQREKTEALEYV